MRLVCRQLGDYLESKKLHTVVLNMNRRSEAHRNATEMLCSLASSSVSGAVSRSARHLIIGSLSPVHDPNFWGPISEDVDTSWAASNKGTNFGPAPNGQVEQLKQALISAIISLSNIHSVAYVTRRQIYRSVSDISQILDGGRNTKIQNGRKVWCHLLLYPCHISNASTLCWHTVAFHCRYRTCTTSGKLHYLKAIPPLTT